MRLLRVRYILPFAALRCAALPADRSHPSRSLYLAAFVYALVPVVMACSAVIGVGAAILWTSQGVALLEVQSARASCVTAPRLMCGAWPAELDGAEPWPFGGLLLGHAHGAHLGCPGCCTRLG